MKLKQAWADGPEEACAFLVVLRPLLQKEEVSSSSLHNDSDTANLLSSLPYWTYHGSEGRNHIIVDLLGSSQKGFTLLDHIDVAGAIVVSNYVTNSGGILAPPIPLEVELSQSQRTASKSNTYSNIERLYSSVNKSSGYSSILPVHRKYLFYFEGIYMAFDDQVLYEVNSQLSLIQKEAFSLSDSNYFQLSSRCMPSNIPAWNGEWRLCYSSVMNRLLQCKEAKFSLIFGPLSSENKSGPATYLRLIESLKCGSIPVVIGLDKLPFDDVIDWQKAALIFPWVLWRDAMRAAAAMNADLVMEYRKQGKFLLHTYFSNANKVFDSIVAIVRKKFLHPPPLAHDFDPTVLLTNGKKTQRHINRDSSQYSNYVLNMRDRIWNVPPGPHFVYPVTPFKPISFHNRQQARQIPLPDSVLALKKTNDEKQVQKFMKIDRLSALKQISDAQTNISKSLNLQAMYQIPSIIHPPDSAVKKSQSVSRKGAAKYTYFKMTEMYSVVTLTHHRDDQIAKQIKLLGRCPFLHKIVIVWNNEYPIPEYMSLPDAKVPIEVSCDG